MAIFSLITLALLAAGYHFYARFLENRYSVSAGEPVPSGTMTA